MRAVVGITLGAVVLSSTSAARAGAQQHAESGSLGAVHFPTSCKPATAAGFDHAVALLHSFEFGASIAGFNDVLRADSTCAMAYWGIALSRWTNPMAAGARPASQLAAGAQAVESARRFESHATARERGYIEAVAALFDNYDKVDQRTRIEKYEQAMADVVARQPADTEAKIFYAIALAAAAPPTDKTYAKQLAAGRILEPIWAKQPNHPGLAHYIIHAYDVPALAPRAAAAAKRYSSIAPDAAHALHMPSHTFTRVGQWQASVETNRRSYDVALGAGSIAEALHASDYSEYALLQLGRDSAAREVVDRLPSLTARFDVNAVTGAAPGSAGVFAIAAIPARYALERHDWPAAAKLRPAASAFPWTEAMTYFARALGAAHLRDTVAARMSIDSLDGLRKKLSGPDGAYWAEQIAIQSLSAQAWLALAAHRSDDALAKMREAAAREDATEKNAVTPGPLAPARELLGDMLLELDRPREALAEYQSTLTKEPNRFRTLYGAFRSATLLGDKAAAAKYKSSLRQLTAVADRAGRPELAEIRAR